MKRYIFLGSILLFQTMFLHGESCLDQGSSTFEREASCGKFIDEKVTMVERNLEELVGDWQTFFQTHDWRSLVAGRTGLNLGCGLVYELPNFLKYPNEDLAIVDMTGISISEPHYHPNMTEIYFMVEGSGCVYVEGEKYWLQQGDTLVIAPNKAHFTVPDKQCVLGCVCTPPFHPDNYIPLMQTNSEVGFDFEQFKNLQENCRT
ncbi:MAG: cupin domain-containing protein [Candidatus Babeliales bacterium]